MTKTQNILGLAFEDNRILVAEVQMGADRPHLHQCSRFKVLPENPPLANPAEMGRKLRQFLKDNQFSAKTAVVGLPAKWLVAKELTIPPTGANALTGVLNIQAERAFSLDPKDLIFDYSGRAKSAASSTLLLMAMQRQRLNQIQTLAKATGLQLIAVTPTSHALRSFGRDESDLSVYVGDGYIESWSGKAELPWIRHSAAPPQQTHLPDSQPPEI